MIISASRRTDIPAFYSEWFFNRLEEGYVCVRNPMNIHQISKINLSPSVVDGIVFWTKNPKPMINKLHLLDKYNYYFQFTVNSYDKDIEPNIPSKNDFIIPTFKELSAIIGSERIIWRYDPILLNEKYNTDYHIKYFEKIAERLSGSTQKCIISFVDLYRNTKRNTDGLNIREIDENTMFYLAKNLSEIAQKNGLKVESCSEKINLEQFGISHGHCIDCELLEKITGSKLKLDKDKNQRKECGCVASIDIGAYNTCKNGCKYCYATFNNSVVEKNTVLHNPNSPLLFGNISPEDKVYQKATQSCRDCQIGLWD